MSTVFTASEPQPPQSFRPQIRDAQLSPAHRSTLASLAKLARIVGVSAIASSLVMVAISLYASSWPILLQAVIVFVVGVLNLGVATGFKEAANAARGEVVAIFGALAELRTLYLFQVGGMLLALAAGAVGVIALLAMLAAR